MRPDDVLRPHSPDPPDRVESTAIDRADEARPERLEALRLAVESGEYSVSATELAGKMIDGHVRD